jgi:hypothetical protein
MYFYPFEKMNMTKLNPLDKKIANTSLQENSREIGEFSNQRTKHNSYRAPNIYQCRCSDCINFYRKKIRENIAKALC